MVSLLEQTRDWASEMICLANSLERRGVGCDIVRLILKIVGR